MITPFRFARITGHWSSSIARAAQTRTGAPLPWYTYPAIDFLTQRTFEGKRVLEFGGGQSTLWWAERAGHVLTIEEDESWHRALCSKKPGNVDLHHIPVDRKTRSVLAVRALPDSEPHRRFDIIVVDGHLRREVTALAFHYLAPNGAILLG